MLSLLKKKTIPEPDIVDLRVPYAALGMSVRTSVKTLASDLPKLYERCLAYKTEKGVPGMKTPWEYISVSRNFGPEDSWEYCTGYVVSGVDPAPPELLRFEAPAGQYAVFPIRGASKRNFGPTLGRMKRYIYGEWLPKGGYEFSGVECEYSEETRNGDRPYDIDLYVGIVKGV